MTGGEFDTLMNIVYSRWGVKAYPKPVVERIWYYVRELPQKSFENMIYTLLDVSRMAPMPQEFKMLSYGERDRLGLRVSKEPEAKPSTEAKCWDCGDSGNLFAMHREKGTSAVFRCHCNIGFRRPEAQGVQWNEQYARTYDKEPVYEKGLGNWTPTKEQRAVFMMEQLQPLLRERDEQQRKGKLERLNASTPAKPGSNDQEPA